MKSARFKTRMFISVLLIAVLAILLCIPVHAETQSCRILILNSYNPGIIFSDNEVAGIYNAFSNESCEFSVEYMDSKRITTQEYRDLLKKSYTLKYKNVHFNAILSLDDDAFQFLLKNRDTLFPETPVIFCGVNNFNDAMITGHPQFTGVVETLSRNETIDLALQLHPGTERVLVVTDQTTSGEINRRIIEEIIATGRFTVPVQFLDVDRKGLSLKELTDKLSHAPPHSVVYYSDFFQDKDNFTYMPVVVMETISAQSIAPIYVHGDQYLGHGAVGGKLNSGLLQGKTAGMMALRIIKGAPVSSLSVHKEGMTAYMVDEQQLKRWGVQVSDIPEGTLFINHEESIIEKYALLIGGVFVFVCAETWIIIVLLFNRRRRIRVEAELRTAERTLRSLIDANPESVILITLDGTIVHNNEVAAKRLGSCSTDTMGKNFFAYLPPEFAKHRKKDLEELKKSRKAVRSIDQQDGRVYDISYVPIFDSGGAIEKIAILAIDITESQRLEETLHRINRKLKNLSEITRVDLENRIYVLQGYIELLNSDMPLQNRSDYFTKLYHMLVSLVNAIGFSRQYQDLGEKLPTWQSINNSFLYAISHIDPGTIRHELLEHDVEIFADPLLENAFLSMIKQTINEGDVATVIRLSVCRENGTLVLVYEDDGNAIPEKEKARLFSPDYSEYRSLFIAREILDVTGISIHESGSGEKGMRFEIRIPPGFHRQHQMNNSDTALDE